MTNDAKDPVTDDLLWRHLKSVPAFRALLRATEARFYQALEIAAPLEEPILDIGCGDGHFAQMTFAHKLTAGVDPWWGPLTKAQASDAYHAVIHSLGNELPFPDNTFATVISNSVLEHIPDVQAVLNEAGRVLKRDGRLVITMPSEYFTQYLGGAQALERMGLPGIARQYRRFFNFISRHARTDGPAVWAERLGQAGFAVVRWQYYFSPGALRALEWGHVQGLPSAVLHFLTGHWVVAPWENNLKRTEQWVRPYYEEVFPDQGAYLFMVARKQANHAVTAQIPPPAPFSKAELAGVVRPSNTAVKEPTPSIPAAAPEEEAQHAEETATIGTAADEPAAAEEAAFGRTADRLISGALLMLALLSTALGQAILNTAPAHPAEGLQWYAWGMGMLLLLAWRQKEFLALSLSWKLPNLGEIPRRRWAVLAGLVLVLAANGAANAGGGTRGPGMALALWAAGIGVTAYALLDPGVMNSLRQAVPRPPPSTLRVSAALFLAALALRAVALSAHPFILNGSEANIGLDAASVVRGQLHNPFATGWLTNPTLPLFLLALPIRQLGTTALAIRLLSPLVGSLTVVATWLFGRRIWGQEVGLMAAVLLAGSHFHLHYSRLGLTNSWDPLLVLLTLGTAALAWEKRDTPPERPLWLASGAAAGLSAYWYTSSHLLPLILATVLLFMLIFDGTGLRQRWRHLAAASLLAFAIALPIMIYYRSHPGLFMERANLLGIFDSRSGWLSREAVRTGLTRAELLRQQWWRGLLAFNSGLDQSPNYRPGRPLLGFGPAVLFVLGLGFTLIRLRQFRNALLVAWVGVTMVFAGTLLESPPSSHRLIIAAPALSLLAGVGLTGIGRLLATLFTNRQDVPSARPISEGLWRALLPAVLLFATSDVAFYFGPYRQQNEFADRNTEIADRMAHYLESLNGEWSAFFHGPPAMYVSFPNISYLAANFQENGNLFDVDPAEADTPVTPSGSIVFIFVPERANEIPLRQNQYPGGQLITFPGHYANPLFYAYEVRS